VVACTLLYEDDLDGKSWSIRNCISFQLGLGDTGGKYGGDTGEIQGRNCISLQLGLCVARGDAPL
jgi:hypothetical protein